MDRDTLLSELNRLLALGEPLLTIFPKGDPDRWWLLLPGNISPEMRWYANSVALRAGNLKEHRHWRHNLTTDEASEWRKDFEAGLLGWRAIGALK